MKYSQQYGGGGMAMLNLFNWLRITGYCEIVALEYVCSYYACELGG